MTTPSKPSPHSPGPWRWNSERTALLRQTTKEEKQARVYPDPPVPDDLPVLVFCEDHGYTPDEADATLIAKAPEMAAMLRELEWHEDPDHYEPWHCPVCGGFKSAGHTQDCRLNALLKELP